jgi:hypothetical protein
VSQRYFISASKESGWDITGPGLTGREVTGVSLEVANMSRSVLESVYAAGNRAGYEECEARIKAYDDLRDAISVICDEHEIPGWTDPTPSASNL